MTRRAALTEEEARSAEHAPVSTLSDRDRELLDYLIDLTWAKILRDVRAARKAE